KNRDDLVLGLVFITFGDIAEQFAVAISLPMIEVAQDERRTGNRQRLMDRAGKRRAGIDDSDGPKPQPFIDLVFVAKLGGGKHPDFVAPIGALLDLLGSPQRFGVIGLAYLIDMRPLELGLGAGRRDDKQYRNQNSDGLSQLT